MSSLSLLRPAARLFAGALLAAWSVALIAWLTLHWGILPRLDAWRPQIEQRVGQALGVPVSIGAIRVRSGGWIPAFEVDDVRLLDREGRVALRLGKVSAALSPKSIWALEPRFAQLHLDGVGLDVRRAADGRVTVAGFDIAATEAAGATDPVLLDWFLQQQEFVIRHGMLRWTDETRDAPPLALVDVDLVLRNGGRRHDLRIDATPPEHWGRRFALRGEFNRPLGSRPSAFSRWRGSLYADLPEADVSQLRRHVDLPFAIEQGRGALRVWLDLAEGRPRAATVDLALSAVELRLGASLPPLALTDLRGRAQATQDAGSLALDIDALSFQTDDGQAWPASRLHLALRRDPAAGADGPWVGGDLQLDRFSLAPLARLAARLPLPPGLHKALVDMAPQGEVSGLALGWSGPPEAPTGYRASARVAGLTLAAGPAGPPAGGLPQTAGRPGLRGATVAFEATEKGGQARWTIKAGAVVLPGVFEQPELALDTAQADLVWTVAPARDGRAPVVAVEVHDAQLANADLALTFGGRWRTGPGVGFGSGQRLPGVLSLQARLLRGEAARVARYLPLGVPEPTRRYVERAFTAGRIVGGDVTVQGDLWQFPFAESRRGSFRIRADVEGVRYAFLPDEPGWVSPWPALEHVAGMLEFDRASMHIRNANAVLGGVALAGVNGGIEDMIHAQRLRLDGVARGELQDMLRFVEGTPVGTWTGHALAQARATGAAELALRLTIPLADPEASTVQGRLQLAGNDLRLMPEAPPLARVHGRIDFTEAGFTVQPTQAQVLGGDLNFEGGTQADGHLRFQGQGRATADALLQPAALPPLAPLLDWVRPPSGARAAARPRLRGQAPYTVQLDLRHGRPEWLVTSPLTGLALDLPAPMAKPAAATWPLRVQTRVQSHAGRAATELLSVDLDGRVQVRMELAADTGRVWRGTVGVGAAAPAMPSTGFEARLTGGALDLDAWRAAAPPGGTVDTTGVPLQLTLETPELRLEGRRLQQVALTLQQRGAGPVSVWRAEGRAVQGEGWVEWESGVGPAAPGRVRARLTRLSVPDRDPSSTAAASVEEPTDAAPRVPSLSVVIDDLRWRDKAMGRLEIEAENRPSPSGDLEWQLDRLRLSTPEATLLGRGFWRAGQRSSLAFDIALNDGGAFFERVGAGKAMRGAAGRIEGELSWPGSPLAPAIGRVRGEVKLALKEGRFLDAEPGVARLFGVLSLQALPRRLLLDFRDVFQQGFAFDSIEGDIQLADGLARTDNLRVLGVQAAVLVGGRADVVHETQDLNVVVVPEINTAGASLAWAAINPAVGIGAFLAQLLLNKPVTAAATREFHVTGSWGEPKVTRLENVFPAAAASAPPVQSP